uniref:Uncharacterized protein n=2 Tax=Caenorhabditis japonica TaxID=281687 RepID=A0A8R1EML0_CAEJA
MEESGITKAREKEEPMSSACGAIVSDTMQIGARKNGEFETDFPNRLTRALSFWKEHAREDWVLSVVESGVVVQLESGAKIPEPAGLRPSMLKYKDFLSSEIEKLAMQGVVEQVQDEPRCVSALHVVDQGKKLRMILDLSALNRSIDQPKFKLENLKTAWPQSVRIVRKDLEEAGVCVAEQKSFWEPRIAFSWLGFDVNLLEGMVAATEKRMTTWWSMLRILKEKDSPSVLDRMKFLGCLASMDLIAGDVAIFEARHLMRTVAAHQSKERDKHNHLRKSKDIPHRDPPEPTSSNTFGKQQRVERLGGKKGLKGVLVAPIWKSHPSYQSLSQRSVLKNMRAHTHHVQYRLLSPMTTDYDTSSPYFNSPVNYPTSPDSRFLNDIQDEYTSLLRQRNLAAQISFKTCEPREEDRSRRAAIDVKNVGDKLL